MSVALDVASWAALTLGAVFCIIGAVGVLRLPDFYTRTHPATIVDTLGAGLVLLGLALQAPGALIAVKLALVFLFILVSSPTAAHALVKAAYAHDVRVDLKPEEPTGERPD